MGNALKFTFHGYVKVEVNQRLIQKKRCLEVLVKDSGIGMTQHNMDRIFQMFQRLNDRDQYEGSGIGLSVARKIVERHGGRIDFDSAPGEGATFRFTLRPAQKGDYENNS